MTEERNKNPQTQTVAEWIRDYVGEDKVDMSKFNVEAKESDDLKASGDNEGKSFKLTIKDVGTVAYPPGDYSDKEETKSTLFFNETEKRMVVRPANNKHLCEKYGYDSSDWVGKAIGVESERWGNATKGGWMWTVRALDVEFDDDIPF